MSNVCNNNQPTPLYWRSQRTIGCVIFNLLAISIIIALGYLLYKLNFTYANIEPSLVFLTVSGLGISFGLLAGILRNVRIGISRNATCRSHSLVQEINYEIQETHVYERVRSTENFNNDSGLEQPISYARNPLEALAKLLEKDHLKLEHLENNEELNNWLNRLVDVKDFQGPNRLAIASVIYDAIQRAELDESYRNVFVACIQEADSTCGDRMALSILYLGINEQIEKAKNDRDLPKLAYLLWHGTYALSQLEIYAQIKKNQLPEADPIEIYLAFPIKLKEALSLPIILDSMLFFNCSDLTQKDLSYAQNEVKSILSNKKLFFDYLIENRSWIELLMTHSETKQAYKSLIDKQENDLNPDDDDIDPNYVQIEQDFKNGLIKLSEMALNNKFPAFIK